MKNVLGVVFVIIVLCVIVLPFVYETHPENFTVSVENGFFILQKKELNGTETLVNNCSYASDALNRAFSLGNVLVKTGEYFINESLIVNRNYVVISGEPNVKIVFAPDLDIEVLVVAHDSIIENLEVQGNNFNSFGIRILGNYNSLINVTVHDVGAISINGFGVCSDFGVSNTLIENCTVYNTGLDGIHARKNTETIIRSNLVYNSSDDGIASVWSVNNQILNNTIDKSGMVIASCLRVSGDLGTVAAYNNLWNSSNYGIFGGDFGGYSNSNVIFRKNNFENCTENIFYEGDVTIE